MGWALLVILWTALPSGDVLRSDLRRGEPLESRAACVDEAQRMIAAMSAHQEVVSAAFICAPIATTPPPAPAS